MEDDCKWSESVEDLIDCGNVDKAISLLESVVSNFETLSSSRYNLELSSALFDLSKLYHSKGLSLKADQAYSRAIILKKGYLKVGKIESEEAGIAAKNDGCPRESSNSSNVDLPDESCSDDDWEALADRSADDWEAIADRSADDLLSPECLPEVSKLSLEEDTESPKRRGRGTFSYNKNGLYSDQVAEGSIVDDSANEDSWHVQTPKYGTKHVLVVTSIPPTTRTIDLEKLLDNFKDRGFVIRWVNDVTALAVFTSPSDALEASKDMRWPFALRILGRNDILLSSIPPEDLEPPRVRPKSSANTAKRLIAHEMGIKLPPSELGSNEARKKAEEARKNRILSRQNMRDAAWGGDDAK